MHFRETRHKSYGVRLGLLLSCGCSYYHSWRCTCRCTCNFTCICNRIPIIMKLALCILVIFWTISRRKANAHLPVGGIFTASGSRWPAVVDPSSMTLTRCERRKRPTITRNSTITTFVWPAVKGQTHFPNLDIFTKNLIFCYFRFWIETIQFFYLNLNCVKILHNFMKWNGLIGDFVQSQKTIQPSRKCGKGADWVIWGCRRGELIVTQQQELYCLVSLHLYRIAKFHG